MNSKKRSFLEAYRSLGKVLADRPLTPLIAAVAIVLLAAILRLAWLTWYSIDVDEAFSLFWAQQPYSEMIPDLLALQGDPHPPGYYAFLKIWISAVGVNEVGLRLYSVFAGILFVALLYRFGRDLFSARAGLVAALLAAVNPALVYESLDARMYMPAGFLILAGAWALWHFSRTGRRLWGLVSLIALVAACYHHLAGAIAIAGLAAGVLIAGFPWRARVRSLGLLGVVGIAFLPYGLNAWQASGTGDAVAIRSAPNFWEMLSFLTRWSLVHEALLLRWLVLLLVVLVWGVVLWGISRSSSSSHARNYLLGCLLVPPLLIVFLSLRQPVLQPKMLAVSPLGFLLVALGMGLSANRHWPSRWSWQRAPFLFLLIMLLGTEFWGFVTMWKPSRQRENWRATAAYLSDHAGPNDVVISHLHFYELPLTFYYDGQVQAPFGSVLLTAEEVANGLEPYLDQEVLWLAQSGTEFTDPDRLLEQWLAARYPLVTEQYPARIALKGFLLNPGKYPPLPGSEEIDISFANGGNVTAFWLDAESLPASDQALHPPSNWLHVTLYATPGNYQLTLEDEAAGVWGANLPREPMAAEGTQDQVQRLDFDINLNPETPPGQYKVVLRLLEDGGPVPRLDNGQVYVILDRVMVTSP